MVKPNYKFNKRQKELARQKKKEEKKGRKESKDEASIHRPEPSEDDSQKAGWQQIQDQYTKLKQLGS